MGHDTKVSIFSKIQKFYSIQIKTHFQYGLLIDDNRDILQNDYADMRDRMYDDARQVDLNIWFLKFNDFLGLSLPYHCWRLPRHRQGDPPLRGVGATLRRPPLLERCRQAVQRRAGREGNCQRE